MKLLQFLGFLLILVGGFWIGMQWGSLSVPPLPERIPPAPVNASIDPVIVPAEPSTPLVEPIAVEKLPETTPTPTPTTPSVVPVDDGSLPKKISTTMNHYRNSSYHFELDIPANLYYSGFSGQDGARQTFGIAKENPETLADAAIRIYYYGKKAIPELEKTAKYEDPAGKFVYFILEDGSAVKVEANNIHHPIVDIVVGSLKSY